MSIFVIYLLLLLYSFKKSENFVTSFQKTKFLSFGNLWKYTLQTTGIWDQFEDAFTQVG